MARDSFVSVAIVAPTLYQILQVGYSVFQDWDDWQARQADFGLHSLLVA